MLNLAVKLNESFSSLLQLQPVNSFTLLLVFIVFLLLLWKWFASPITTNPPPSPPKLPIIGNLHQLGLHPHRSLQALSQRHGPLMLLHFGSVPVLVASSAEAAHEILRTHDLIFADRPKSTIYEKLFYNYKDISTAPYGEYWRKVKSICVLNLLSNKRVRSFRGVREEETQLMISNIAKQSESSSVLNLSEMVVMLTNDVVCRVALGKKYSTKTSSINVGSGKMLKEVLGDFTDLLGSCVCIGDYIPWLAWLTRVNGLDAKLDKVAKQFDDFLDAVVQEHMDRSSKRGKDECYGQFQRENEEEKADLVDILLGIQKENSVGLPIDRVCVKALLLDMFTAGTDTVHTILEWVMAELIRHPRVMNKLQNEVRGIVGNKTDVITEDDLVEMHYLKAVIKETLRLHPPIPLLIPRLSTQDVTIHGYNIKAKTQVLVNIWQIGRDPKSFDKPEEFDPERFLNSGIDYKGNDFEFLPFGAGRRGCPGIQFGMAVNEIALANLVHKFDWSLPGGARAEDLDMTESTGLTKHRKYPLEAIAVPYDIPSC